MSCELAAMHDRETRARASVAQIARRVEGPRIPTCIGVPQVDQALLRRAAERAFRGW